uniref:G-protein coupled receptors family 1 profile domain-containing protein n=1 Tax=Acrobeloides nanus TaxID=290746 RepID=A0A914BUX4_9BILA
MSFSPNSTQYSYYKDPAYIGITYDRLFYAYTIVVGGLSAIGNLYIILLFTQFSKLRSVLCNWLIVYLCVPDVLIGIACVYQSIIKMIVMDNNIVGFSFVLCNVLQIPYGLGYRIGQTIACMMACDRLIAIWKPIFYARWQSNDKSKKGPKSLGRRLFGLLKTSKGSRTLSTTNTCPSEETRTA